MLIITNGKLIRQKQFEVVADFVNTRNTGGYPRKRTNYLLIVLRAVFENVAEFFVSASPQPDCIWTYVLTLTIRNHDKFDLSVIVSIFVDSEIAAKMYSK